MASNSHPPLPCATHALPALDHHMKRASSPSPSYPNKRPAPTPASPAPTPAKLALPPLTAPARPPPFQQPAPLLTFSYDAAHAQHFDDSARRYFVEPPPGADLNHGYARWVRRPDERGRLDALLRAYERIREQAGAGRESVQAGALCWRGVMTKILLAPYETRDGHSLNVMLLNGTLYLEEHSTAAKLAEKNDMPARQRLMTYYGYAFESWCTAETPAGAGWGGDVDTNVQWCQVVKTRLGGTRLVMGGEVDCVRPGGGAVELKTSMAIRGPQDAARFEAKLLKFYMQSFLLGVPEIVVGFRTHEGRLKTTQRFETLALPRMVRGKPGAWDAQVCLAWGDAVLAWLRAQLEGGAAGLVWRVVFTPGEGVALARLDEEGVRDVEGGEERVGFLPRWYWERELAGDGAGSEESAAGAGAERAPQPAAGSAREGTAREALESEAVSEPSAAKWKI